MRIYNRKINNCSNFFEYIFYISVLQKLFIWKLFINFINLASHNKINNIHKFIT